MAGVRNFGRCNFIQMFVWMRCGCVGAVIRINGRMQLCTFVGCHTDAGSKAASALSSDVLRMRLRSSVFSVPCEFVNNTGLR